LSTTKDNHSAEETDGGGGGWLRRKKEKASGERRPVFLARLTLLPTCYPGVMIPALPSYQDYGAEDIWEEKALQTAGR
jgi:hypothetical protein